MTMRENLLFALTGWVAGLCSTLGVALVAFPAVMGDTRSISTWPDLLLFGLIVLLISPFTLVGGLLGGRVPREGGRSGQLIMAAIIAMVAAVPFSCVAFWYTGW